MRVLINFLLFQFGWFSSVLGGANGLPWLGPIAVLIVVAVHLRLSERPANETALIASCALLGALFDSALVTLNWVSYSSGMIAEFAAPYWIVAMWMSFATTLNVSLRWLRKLPLVAAACGLVAGPLTYLGGAKFGGIEFLDMTAAMTALGVGWAVMLPLLLQLAERFDGFEPGSGFEHRARAGGREHA